jgi:hypothetical protein
MSSDTEGSQTNARRPRTLARARVGWPLALQQLKDLLYETYQAAGAPSLDTIARDVSNDDDLTSIFLDGPPTESVDRFRVVG